MDNNKIGKFIASLRKEKGLTQQELGAKLFVTDKAVSKWERGLSLPDISLLEKLATELGTDIYSILQIEQKNHVDVEKILNEERRKLKKQVIKKTILIMLPFFIILSVVLFKLIPFGYDVIPIRYTHNEDKLIHLGIPKFSWHLENYEDSYSYKSFRGQNILKSEMKNYLNTLEHIACNDTTYYYDSDADVTVANYSVTGNILYNTASYNIKNGNYCDQLQIKEYKEKLGRLNTIRTLNDEESELSIYFIPSLKKEEGRNKWLASLKIYYGNDESTVLEASNGTFEIKEDELVYYRTEISEQKSGLEIPNVSTFVIKDKNLILKENYLDDYEKGIILK